MAFNEARKISEARKQMHIAVNAMRDEIKSATLKHFDKAFVDEGFTDRAFWHWKPIKRHLRKPQYKDMPILQNTGRLRRNTKAFANSNQNGFKIRFTNSTKYAAVHNEGLRAGRGSGFKMPKRMFMGYSLVLDRKLQKIFNTRIRRIFPK